MTGGNLSLNQARAGDNLAKKTVRMPEFVVVCLGADCIENI